jgi:tetratricopeptide (TPR) repeat protein
MGWSAFKLDQLEEAQTWLEHAVEQNPAHPATRWALGHVHMAQNSFDSAEREFLRSIALKDSYRARQALGFLYHRSGKLDEARAVYMEGLRLRPDDPKRHEAYADFLSDVGLNAEATEYYERAKELPHDDDG